MDLLREGQAQAKRLQRDIAQGARAMQGWPSRRGNTRRHAYKGAIIQVIERGGVGYELHATKGWRRVGTMGWPR